MSSCYEVTFFYDGLFNTIRPPKNRGIGDLKEGFWVDANYQWCVASKVKYYIMPHHITKIELINE